jgi:hypothetical protein
MAVVAGVLLGLATAAGAQVVTRGPYLQLGTDASIVIRWRTDVITDSRVQLGTAPETLDRQIDDANITKEHVVPVAGLAADTTYYYAIGTGGGTGAPAMTLAGGDAEHRFVTAPAPGVGKPTRIWAIGDSGTADASVAAVRDAYLAYAGDRPTDVWLMLGDNAYPSGTDAQYQTAVFTLFAGLLRRNVLWPTLGNHDGRSSTSATQTGPYYNAFTLPALGEAGGVASGTEAYYSFDYGDIHFVCLDSFGVARTAGSPMMSWLASDLQATVARWIIAFWHHPPYSKGSHDSDRERELIEMRENALPLLEAAGVDLVLGGHSHSYERSVLLDGHYGASATLTEEMTRDPGSGRIEETGAYSKAAAPHEGAVYVVAGSGGHVSGGPLDHPAMFVAWNLVGSVVVDVDGDRLDGVFLDDAGGIRDHFTLLKHDPLPTSSTTTTTTTSTTMPADTTTTTSATTTTAITTTVTTTSTTAPTTSTTTTTTTTSTTALPTTTASTTTLPTATTAAPTTTTSTMTPSSTTVAPTTTTTTTGVLETSTTVTTTEPTTTTVVATTTTTTSLPTLAQCQVDGDCDDADDCTTDRCTFGRCVSLGSGGVEGARCALAADPSHACGSEPMDPRVVSYIAVRMAKARLLVDRLPAGAPPHRRIRVIRKADRALQAIAKHLATAVRKKMLSGGCGEAVGQRIRTVRRALSDV